MGVRMAPPASECGGHAILPPLSARRTGVRYFLFFLLGIPEIVCTKLYQKVASPGLPRSPLGSVMLPPRSDESFLKRHQLSLCESRSRSEARKTSFGPSGLPCGSFRADSDAPINRRG